MEAVIIAVLAVGGPVLTAKSGHLLLGLCLNCILYNVHFTLENLPNSVKKTTVSSNAAELGEKNYINNILFFF